VTQGKVVVAGARSTLTGRDQVVPPSRDAASMVQVAWLRG
jgi:hypothetical protein